jgi:hypothetical protein
MTAKTQGKCIIKNNYYLTIFLQTILSSTLKALIIKLNLYMLIYLLISETP